MITPSVLWLFAIGKGIYNSWKKLAVIAVVVVGIVGLINTLIVDAIDSIAAKVAALNLSALQQINFNSIPSIGYVNAMFPLSEFVALLVIYYTAWLLLILIRWIKSFVPTVSN